MKTYEQIVNQFFTDRYDYLLTCANNILKLIKRQDLKYNLVNDCYMYILSHKEKLTPLVMDKGKIEAIAVNWQTMQIKWNNTQFKKDWVYKDNSTLSYDNIIKSSDSETDFLNSFMVDNNSSEEETLQQEKEIQDKLDHINAVVTNLTLDKQLLYNDVFNLGINTSGKLAKHTGISRTGCYFLIKDLKETIKTTYKNK